MILCLATAGKVATVTTSAFMLVWTHSVEKTRWEENWRITPAGLVLDSARIKGSGAGMEPPPHAKKDGAWFSWKNTGEPMRQLTLARSGAVEDWRICTRYECVSFDLLLGPSAGPVTLSACEGK